MKIGIDIVDVKRIKRIMFNKRFIERVFSKKEIKYCNSFKNKHERFAARFAAKEAFIKCLGSKKKPPLNMIEIINSKDGVPYIYVNGKMIKNCLVSLSHVEEYAVAVCVIK